MSNVISDIGQRLSRQDWGLKQPSPYSSYTLFAKGRISVRVSQVDMYYHILGNTGEYHSVGGVNGNVIGTASVLDALSLSNSSYITSERIVEETKRVYLEQFKLYRLTAINSLVLTGSENQITLSKHGFREEWNSSSGSVWLTFGGFIDSDLSEDVGYPEYIELVNWNGDVVFEIESPAIPEISGNAGYVEYVFKIDFAVELGAGINLAKLLAKWLVGRNVGVEIWQNAGKTEEDICGLYRFVFHER